MLPRSAMICFGTLLAARATACPYEPAEIGARADLAYERYLGADAEGLAAALLALEEAVACPTRPPDAALAARVHGAEAIGRFVARDLDAVARAFTGARRADPTFDFFAHAADNGNTLAQAWSAPPSPEAVPLEPLPATGGARWWVDGREEGAAPARGAATWLVQVDGEEVRWSGYGADGLASLSLPAPAPRPAPALPAPGPAPQAPLPRPPTRGRAVTALWAGAGVSGALGLASLGTAWGISRGVRGGTLDPDRRDLWQPVNATTAALAPVLGGVAVGLAGAAVLIGR